MRRAVDGGTPEVAELARGALSGLAQQRDRPERRCAQWPLSHRAHGTARSAVLATVATLTLLTGAAHAATLAPGAGYDGSGQQVRALQLRLAQSGARPGPVDGRFGPLTEAAVVRFQAAHGLARDGVAGPATLHALSTHPATLHPGAGLGGGDGSAPVKALQRTLGAHGFSPGPIDGRFGPLTQRAVERFQRAGHLRVDGVVGVRTWRALDAPATRPAPAVSAPAIPAPSRRTPATPAPSSLPQPAASPAQHRSPVLPIGIVLIALAMLGLLTGSISYTRTRSKVRRAIHSQRLRSLRIADGPLPNRGGHRIQDPEVQR